MLFLLLFIPSIVNWSMCSYWEKYNIINYSQNNLDLVIKDNLPYNILFFSPFIKINNIKLVWVHYKNSWSNSCEYDNFHELNTLSYFNLTLKDKIIIILNLYISLWITFLILYSFYMWQININKRNYKSFKIYK